MRKPSQNLKIILAHYRKMSSALSHDKGNPRCLVQNIPFLIKSARSNRFKENNFFKTRAFLSSTQSFTFGGSAVSQIVNSQANEMAQNSNVKSTMTGSKGDIFLLYLRDKHRSLLIQKRQLKRSFPLGNGNTFLSSSTLLSFLKDLHYGLIEYPQHFLEIGSMSMRLLYPWDLQDTSSHAFYLLSHVAVAFTDAWEIYRKTIPLSLDYANHDYTQLSVLLSFFSPFLKSSKEQSVVHDAHQRFLKSMHTLQSKPLIGALPYLQENALSELLQKEILWRLQVYVSHLDSTPFNFEQLKKSALETSRQPSSTAHDMLELADVLHVVAALTKVPVPFPELVQSLETCITLQIAKNCDGNNFSKETVFSFEDICTCVIAFKNLATDQKIFQKLVKYFFYCVDASECLKTPFSKQNRYRMEACLAILQLLCQDLHAELLKSVVNFSTGKELISIEINEKHLLMRSKELARFGNEIAFAFLKTSEFIPHETYITCTFQYMENVLDLVSIAPTALLSYLKHLSRCLSFFDHEQILSVLDSLSNRANRFCFILEESKIPTEKFLPRLCYQVPSFGLIFDFLLEELNMRATREKNHFSLQEAYMNTSKFFGKLDVLMLRQALCLLSREGVLSHVSRQSSLNFFEVACKSIHAMNDSEDTVSFATSNALTLSHLSKILPFVMNSTVDATLVVLAERLTSSLKILSVESLCLIGSVCARLWSLENRGSFTFPIFFDLFEDLCKELLYRKHSLTLEQVHILWTAINASLLIQFCLSNTSLEIVQLGCITLRSISFFEHSEAEVSSLLSLLGKMAAIDSRVDPIVMTMGLIGSSTFSCTKDVSQDRRESLKHFLLNKHTNRQHVTLWSEIENGVNGTNLKNQSIFVSMGLMIEQGVRQLCKLLSIRRHH